ncbi:hypothetical protein QR680_012974 [Steinernema hermaphroditum]|uniref:SXP/RAL-2 family protein Ani s 5-like cation-binding domain-containing protein n=1 Tax=Steinernema hermaphroditum TaxID=289476 RepID=A0AA39M1H3_9BILA|nr:hypothetical protein QR680_012974 [Steinernema hermaphroditum]
MIFTALLFVLCLCSHSTVSMPLYSDASILRIPYRSQALRPFVESQRRTKFVRSIDEYESERRREKSRAELEGLTDIVAESIKQQAEEAQRAIKADMQTNRRTLSRLLQDLSNYSGDKNLIYRPG